MEKAIISTPEDHMTFEHVWHQWMKILKRDRCVVCGELKETMMLPVDCVIDTLRMSNGLVHFYG